MAKGQKPVNGFDKRPQAINRKGRPKSFDALRALAIRLSHEETTSEDGEIVTNIEKIMREWISDPRNQEKFVQYAFGKVPDKVELSGAVKYKVTVKDDQDG
jgi:hypothetical protein